MYLLQLGPIVYTPKGREGFTLTEALRECYGVGHASILRLDGTPVVLNAGSSVEIFYAPTGRPITRRPRRPWVRSVR